MQVLTVVLKYKTGRLKLEESIVTGVRSSGVCCDGVPHSGVCRSGVCRDGVRHGGIRCDIIHPD